FLPCMLSVKRLHLQICISHVVKISLESFHKHLQRIDAVGSRTKIRLHLIGKTDVFILVDLFRSVRIEIRLTRLAGKVNTTFTGRYRAAAAVSHRRFRKPVLVPSARSVHLKIIQFISLHFFQVLSRSSLLKISLSSYKYARNTIAYFLWKLNTVFTDF